MANFQALAVVLAAVGAFFVALAIAPLSIFDRFQFWNRQAQWFRANRAGSIVARLIWGGFGLFLWAFAGLVLVQG